MKEIYKGAFTTVKTGDPDYYNDVTVDDMMTELAQPTHVLGSSRLITSLLRDRGLLTRFPVLEHTLGSLFGTRNQPTKLSELQRAEIHDQGRFLTSKMREQGLNAPPVMYVTQDEEDYFIHTGKLSKALAANAIRVDLNGICVPIRQDDVVIRMQQVM